MRVSVIVPVYNCEPYIGKCVESLLGQTYGDIEYVFVDDASTDGSMAVLEEAVARHEGRKSAVKTVRHAQNQGSAASRHDGLEQASGEWTICVDSDDYVHPNYVAHLVELGERTGADMVVCDYCEEYGDDSRKEKKVNLPKAKDDVLSGIIVGTVKGYLVNKLVRRRLWDDVVTDSGFFSIFEDKNCTMQLCLAAEKIVYLPEALYVYNRRNLGNSQSSRKKSLLIGDAIRITKLTKSMLEDSAGKVAQEKVWKAYDEFCIGIMGLILLYGNKEQKMQYDAVCGKRYPLSLVWHQPVIPIYYKAAVACREAHLGALVPLLRWMLAAGKWVVDKMKR